jgi:hypothetical protein
MTHEVETYVVETQHNLGFHTQCGRLIATLLLTVLEYAQVK